MHSSSPPLTNIKKVSKSFFFHTSWSSWWSLSFCLSHQYTTCIPLPPPPH
jgi:hypothetical protein